MRVRVPLWTLLKFRGTYIVSVSPSQNVGNVSRRCHYNPSEDCRSGHETMVMVAKVTLRLAGRSRFTT